MKAGQRIYLIGFMGSGKTTAGKKLATLLGWPFIDLDKKIEEEAGMTIPEIFSKYGEDYFRSTESKVLRSIKSEKNTVVSTGGGAPCHDGNMDFMLNSGLTIYLKLTAGQLQSRLSNSKGERPLIKGLKGEKLVDFIKEKLVDRELWYMRAEVIHEGIDVDINLLYSTVLSRLHI